jgi:hypothetical protein
MPADPPVQMPVQMPVKAPRPRWAPLPGDPPALRRWLAEQRGETSQGQYPSDWPQEPSP